jgi:hypothetical protein
MLTFNGREARDPWNESRIIDDTEFAAEKS